MEDEQPSDGRLHTADAVVDEVQRVPGNEDDVSWRECVLAAVDSTGSPDLTLPHDFGVDETAVIDRLRGSVPRSPLDTFETLNYRPALPIQVEVRVDGACA